MRILKNIFIIFAVTGALLLVLLFLNDKANQKVFVREYTVENEKIPNGFNGSKIMVIADMHNTDFTHWICDHIDVYEPDWIVICGDMVQLPHTSIDNTLKIVNHAAQKGIPAYAVSGNHDRLCGKYYENIDILWANDVYMLENGSVRLEKNGDEINLIGIKDPKMEEVTDEKMNIIRSNIEYELSKSDAFSILLSHRADIYPGIKDLGVDLILSGHLHGGVIRLPLIGGVISKNKEDRFFPDYEYGYYEGENASDMIVSGGCDKNPEKRRFFNPPEILLVTLQGE